MSQPNLDKDREAYLAAVGEMYDELRRWRAEHPGASIDEIAGQITPRRREMMGELMKQLAVQQGDGEEIEGVACPDCGEGMIYKGRSKRGVTHLEGETTLERAYYYCAQCEQGFFPPG